MHFDVLVEDQSGKKALDILIPKIIGDHYTFEVHAYKGIGRIPPGMRNPANARHRILLQNLPKLLRGYGKTFAGYPEDYPAAVFVVCDLDDKCLRAFRKELMDLLNHCDPAPVTRFCFAIEEGEAWLLGDLDALQRAYPAAKKQVIDAYAQDSICGTWELLANAVYPGGAEELKRKGWHATGEEKSIWAERIAPHMEVERNVSPSFGYFVSKLRELMAG